MFKTAVKASQRKWLCKFFTMSLC